MDFSQVDFGILTGDLETTIDQYNNSNNQLIFHSFESNSAVDWKQLVQFDSPAAQEKAHEFVA